MPAYKDKRYNTWFVVMRYVDWTGARKTTTKRGFKTLKEAREYETNFKLKKDRNLNMTFGEFLNIYYEDLSNRLKENTLVNKRYILDDKIEPYFKNRNISEINAADIIEWQNKMLAYRDSNGNPYKPTYLKTLHNQLSAIFNHAVRYYGLKENPARRAGNMGKEKTTEMLFWTKEEYIKFSKAMMKKDGVYQGFEMLYWCGLRLGEMLALTPASFDFDKNMVIINKSYQRIKGKDIITDPKTERSNRVVKMPPFLVDEIKDYISRLYNISDDDRIFLMSKSKMHHEMNRGCKESGVKRIRIHDLRHSHVSLLIEMGFNAVDISNRVGHESIDITYRYAHMFPSKDQDIADKLEEFRGGAFDESQEFR